MSLDATEASRRISGLARRSREALAAMGEADIDARNGALLAASEGILAATSALLDANAGDITRAREKGVSGAFIDRLTLTEERIAGVAEGLKAIAALDDPIGVELARWTRPNGLDISRISTPLGVIGVIFEARPNVTVDAAALVIKSANSAILRGGNDSHSTSSLLAELMRQGLQSAGLPPDAVIMVDTSDRTMVGAMLAANGEIDVIVPRGGRSLVERVQKEARIPVFAHLEGICHVYIHAGADAAKAKDIAVNAKMRRTGICGSMETLLIDRALVDTIWPDIAEALHNAGCEIRGDTTARAACPWIKPASNDDYGHEFLDAVLAVKTVDHLEAAIDHIRHFGSDHTEAIITEDTAAAEHFVKAVDSAIVMVNASTQFADGGEFGMGGEIGIATGRIHARGPVGANQLTCFKYIVRGNGQIRP